MTEPAVGASTCASGSQVWNGNIGTLIANARKNAPNAKNWSVRVEAAAGLANARSVSKSKRALARLPPAPPGR